MTLSRLGTIEQVIAGDAQAHVAHADALDFLRALPPASCDILVTDPPYSSGGMVRGDRAKGGAVKYSKAEVMPEIEGDTMDQRAWTAWCATWLRAARRAMKPCAFVIMFADWRQVPAASDALQAGGVTWRGMLPWHKGPAGGRGIAGRFRQSAEFALWGTFGPAPEQGGKVYTIPAELPLPRAERHAVCSKPVALMEALLGPCPVGGVVLDPFVGWGATPVAALRRGLRFLGCEISEANRATALARIEGVEVAPTVAAA